MEESTNTSGHSNNINTEWRWLGLVLLIAAALRIYDLTFNGLWLDELFTIARTDLPIGKMLELLVTEDAHPPLYYLIIYSVIKIFGSGEVAVRMPSVIFGVATVYAVYKFTALAANNRAALYASLIVALSTFQVTYSRDARMYSLLSLLTTCSMYYFLKLFHTADRKTMAAYVVFSILLFYTHIYSSFIFIAQNIVFLLIVLFGGDRKRPTLKQWLILETIVFMAHAPWLPFMYVQANRFLPDFWIPRPALIDIWRNYLVFSGSYSAYFLLMLMILMSIFSFSGNMPAFSRKNLINWIDSHLYVKPRNSFISLVLLSWIACPVIIPFLVSNLLPSSIYWPRYTIPASIGFYIMAAIGLAQINMVWPRRLILFALLALFCLHLYDYYSTPWHSQSREAVLEVQKKALPGDVILEYYSTTPHFEYYAKDLDFIELEKIDEGAYTLAETKRWVGESPRVWVVIASWKGDPSSIFERLDELGYKKQNEFGFHLADVKLYVKNSD